VRVGSAVSASCRRSLAFVDALRLASPTLRLSAPRPRDCAVTEQNMCVSAFLALSSLPSSFRLLTFSSVFVPNRRPRHLPRPSSPYYRSPLPHRNPRRYHWVEDAQVPRDMVGGHLERLRRCLASSCAPYAPLHRTPFVLNDCRRHSHLSCSPFQGVIFGFGIGINVTTPRTSSLLSCSLYEVLTISLTKQLSVRSPHSANFLFSD
jgi:hypothetical protein